MTAYRPDIDGLRAIAVLAVVLFHAGVPGVSGGFIGVDVFFVISGFLITSLISDDLRAGNFSLARFYERRARRILPALLIVMLVAAIAAWVSLLPEQLARFGLSLAAAAGFGSNVVFWYEVGYFDSESALKPLLHTWSLGVEEQFYLLFPIFLWLATRGGARLLRVSLVVLILMSLTLSVAVTPGHRAAAFFLAPTRAWELLIGAALAVMPPPPATRAIAWDLLGWAALAAILASVALLSGELAFPGAYPLAACAGTAVLIRLGNTGRGVSRLLALRPLVFIGLISYSLYLWHWVLLSFLRNQLIRPPRPFELAAAVVMSFVLAILSWHFIETPVRRRLYLRSTRRLAATLGLGSVAALAFGLACHASGGFPGRIPPDINALASATRERIRFEPGQCQGMGAIDGCQIGSRQGPIDFVLWGDSHASALAPLVDSLAQRQGKHGLAFVSGGCPPALGVERFDDPRTPTCGQVAEEVLRRIDALRVSTVVLVARWPIYIEGSRYGVEEGPAIRLEEHAGVAGNPARVRAGLRAVLERLRTGGIRVFLVGGVPEVGYNVPVALARKALSNSAVEIAPTLPQFEARQRRSFAILEEAARDYGATMLYPHHALCDAGECRLMSGTHVLYFDDDHLSITGARFVESAFADLRF